MWSWLKFCKGRKSETAAEPARAEESPAPTPPYRRAAEPPKADPPILEGVLEDPPGPPLLLMYNIQGGEGLAPEKLAEFMVKSKRRATRYFRGKEEVKHRVTYRSKTAIEFEFNRSFEPQVVPGKSVLIRWVNKANEEEIAAL